MQEIWKPAPGFEDLYLVSNLGNIMSLDYRHTGEHKIIKLRKSRGYLVFHRTEKGGSISIHRLVALAFIPNPDNLPCVNHINENKIDNRAENLEWCDYKYNNTYGSRLNKMAQTRRNRTKKSHFGNIMQYSISEELVSTFRSTVAASKATGIDRSSINRCALGQTKTAGGYKWVYEPTEHTNLSYYEQSNITNDIV